MLRGSSFLHSRSMVLITSPELTLGITAPLIAVAVSIL